MPSLARVRSLSVRVMRTQVMRDIPEWAEAVATFRRFLEGCGQPAVVRWVFREDLYQPEPELVFVRADLPEQNPVLAAKVLADGRAKGLVELLGLASTGSGVLATTWYPKLEGEEIQGWDRGMKLSLRSPLPRAVAVSRMGWGVRRWTRAYGRFQREARFLGSREWAAA